MTTDPLSERPGEARTRRRRQRMYVYLAIAGALGAVMGGLVAMSDTGGGDLFAGDLDQLTLAPAVAIALCLLVLVGFVALPLWGFTQIDELQKEENLVGFTGGCIAVLGGFPIWALLSAGGLSHTPPTGPGVFGLALVGMLAAFLLAKFRNR